MPGNIKSDIRDLEKRMRKTLAGFDKPARKRILRKASRPVVLQARKTSAFRDRTGVLRKSLNRVPGLRKSPDEFVGPLAGKNRRYDGYYAAMVFGSRAAFKRYVLDPAARLSQQAVFTIIKTQSRELIQQLAAKNKLN